MVFLNLRSCCSRVWILSTATVRPMERLGEGSLAQLHFHPPNGSSFDVEAIVWRVDRDGLAFCFTHDQQRRLSTLLAQLAGAPAGPSRIPRSGRSLARTPAVDGLYPNCA